MPVAGVVAHSTTPNRKVKIGEYLVAIELEGNVKYRILYGILEYIILFLVILEKLVRSNLLLSTSILRIYRL